MSRPLAARVFLGRIFVSASPAMSWRGMTLLSSCTHASGDTSVVSTFIVPALRGEPITLCGDVTQTSSFCCVDDMIEVCIQMMASAPGFAGPVNLGSPDAISMRELAEKIRQLGGLHSATEFGPLPGDDATHRQPDFRRACEIRSWISIIRLEKGLNRTISFVDHLLGRRRVEPGLGSIWQRHSIAPCAR